MGTCHSYNILFIFKDDLLLTSAENGDIENVTQALTSGANVNVCHGGDLKVSTLIK